MNSNNTISAAEEASNKTWNEYFKDSFRRDGRLLLIMLLIIICMNIPYIKYILYPFTIYSTWIHELCHGLAAILAGGSIDKLLIFPDTSGLAYTAVPSNRRGFVASAGYQGTAVIGCFLLLLRRTKRGPRSGTMTISFLMVISCLLWIRNIFGFIFIFVMGVLLIACAWKLPSTYIRNVYIVLAVTCSLNAITSVHNLFGASYTVNGQDRTSTDAHTMADIKGGNYLSWAILWLILALILTILGILFAIPGPDEVADFQCCGVCQDWGCFKICNYPGQRMTSRIRESVSHSNNNHDNGLPSTDNNNRGTTSAIVYGP